MNSKLKCNKTCKCCECEYYGGREIITIENEKLSTEWNKHYAKLNLGIVCTNGYRIALNDYGLKNGYNETDYIFVDNDIRKIILKKDYDKGC